MIAMRAGTKRARPEDAAAASKQAMRMEEEELGGDVRMEDEDARDNQREESEDERARRKRAMRVRADLRSLEKLPTLREYQRGRFGRRGGVDGGAPHDDASLWMRALERSLEETSFVTGEAPARAALVAPLAGGIPGGASRGYGVTPVTPAPTPVHRANLSTLPPHGLRAGTAAGMDMRSAFAGFVAVAPRASARAAVMAGGGKDDEARSAD